MYVGHNGVAVLSFLSEKHLYVSSFSDFIEPCWSASKKETMASKIFKEAITAP